MRWPWRAGLLSLFLVLASDTAAAHEIAGSRFDAPLPLWLLYAGAGVTVAATAGWLAASGQSQVRSDTRRRGGEIPGNIARWIGATLRGSFFVAFLLVVWFGLFGPQVPAENFATVFVWPIWLKGIGVVAALVGSPWRLLSPWRTIYDGLCRLEGDQIAVHGSYPSWLREWPALAGFVVWTGVVENLTVVPRSPRGTTVLVVGYALVMVLGAVVFGEEWFDRADALAVLYRLFGRVAPIDLVRTHSGDFSITLRAPWQGCMRPVRDLALVGFVVATVYTVSFDGFTSTPEYQTLLFGVRDASNLGHETSVLLYVVGFMLFLGSFATVISAADIAGGRRDVYSAFHALAPTVLPIAVAYEIAHNYPYVARNLGQLAFVMGRYFVANPAAVEPLAWLSLPAFWTSQVLLIVGGHVVAVVAAHGVTVERYPTRMSSVRAHLPLTVLMIGYTVLSLWIVSRPVVS